MSPKSENPAIMDRREGFTLKKGAIPLPTAAPMINNKMGSTYNKNVKKSMGRVSSPITTWSPFSTSSVLSTVTIIAFCPLAVLQLFLVAQDSHAPDRIVFTQAMDASTWVTIPFSVIIFHRLEIDVSGNNVDNLAGVIYRNRIAVVWYFRR